jgi:hypothetical protein
LNQDPRQKEIDFEQKSPPPLETIGLGARKSGRLDLNQQPRQPHCPGRDGYRPPNAGRIKDEGKFRRDVDKGYQQRIQDSECRQAIAAVIGCGSSPRIFATVAYRRWRKLVRPRM